MREEGVQSNDGYDVYDRLEVGPSIVSFGAAIDCY